MRPAWTDLAAADRRRLAELGRQVGLPLELITYSLLSQRRPQVVPCAAWLYCTWQIPVVAPRSAASGEEPAIRLVEVKVCLSPAAIVTMQGRGQRPAGVLPTILPDGLTLIRHRLTNLLVTLVERIGEAYLTAYGKLRMSADGRARPSVAARALTRGRGFAKAQLLRHVRAHRAAVERLVVHGRRWLDVTEIGRLEASASRLARLRPPSPRRRASLSSAHGRRQGDGEARSAAMSRAALRRAHLGAGGVTKTCQRDRRT